MSAGTPRILPVSNAKWPAVFCTVSPSGRGGLLSTSVLLGVFVNKNVFSDSIYWSQLEAQDWFPAHHSATHGNVFSGLTGFPVATESSSLGRRTIHKCGFVHLHSLASVSSPAAASLVFRLLKSSDFLGSKIAIRSPRRRWDFTYKNSDLHFGSY